MLQQKEDSVVPENNTRSPEENNPPQDQDLNSLQLDPAEIFNDRTRGNNMVVLI